MRCSTGGRLACRPINYSISFAYKTGDCIKHALACFPKYALLELVPLLENCVVICGDNCGARAAGHAIAPRVQHVC